jgi:tetratricopeptide (TPR) repeat protein
MFRFRYAALLAFVASLTGQSQQAKGSIAEIQSLIRSQDYDQALQMTQVALQSAPGDARLWTLEGIVFSVKGSNSEAIHAFDKALGISPNYPAALKGEVQLLYSAQDRRAIPLLERIIKADPKDETAHEMLALFDKQEDHCHEAVDQFASSGDVISKHPASLEAYGYCLIQTKQPAKAIPVFEELAALIPDQTFPRYDLAVVLVDAKQSGAAIKILEPLLAAEPSDVELLSLASEAYEATGDTPKAVSLLRQAIVLQPKTANLYTSFAALCLNHDSFQVGIDMINAGLKQITNDPSLYISRGLLYAQLASYDKAEADFNTAEHLDSRQSLSSYAIDLSELQKNQSEKHHSEKELAGIRGQLKAHPDSALLHYLLAKLLADQGSDTGSAVSTEAIRSALVAVKIKPDLVDARDLLASLYLRSGKYSLAIEQCHLALQYAPDDQGGIYHLIIALRHTKQAGEDEEIGTLVRRLSELQQATLQQDTDRKRFRLVEQPSAAAK